MREFSTMSFAILALAAALPACGSHTPPPAPVLLDPPPAGQGVQYEMTTTIDGSSEVQRCKFVTAPAEGLNINHDEVRFTAGSHHFLLYETAYTSIPTQKDDGTPVTLLDPSGVFDCTSGPTQGWTVTKLVGGSQNGMGESMLDFPDGVALKVSPGAVLLMNTHYINTSPAAIQPDVRINLYTIPDAQVMQEGDVLFLYNAFIKAPAQAMSDARMRCPIRSDITLTNFQSHMHARGVGYQASIVGEAMPFYTSSSWENVPVEQFQGGKTLKAGSVIDYQCDYDNPAPNDVYQGPTTKDEMCMAIGSFYPKDPATANCANDPANPGKTQNLGADWVGSGTATCAASLGCIKQAFGQMPVLHAVTSCVVASDPSVSHELSDAVRCILLNGSNALTACSAQISACSAK
jgi:hypothetical protein